MFDPNKIKELQEDNVLIKKVEIKQEKTRMIDIPLGVKSSNKNWLSGEIIKFGKECSKLKDDGVHIGSKVLINEHLYGDDFERFGDYIIVREGWIWAEII